MRLKFTKYCISSSFAPSMIYVVRIVLQKNFLNLKLGVTHI